MPRVIEEAFDLTQESSDVTQADTTVNEWGDLFLYQVPTGTSHVLKPEHTFSAYLKDTNGTELTANQQVKVEVRDSTQSDSKTFFGPTIYQTVKEFQDRQKKAKLQVSAPVYLREKMYIVIMVKNTDSYGADKDDSYFDLAINRVRQSL